MAYVSYKFSRPKNAYEKSLDYNERLTWWVSFITNWFWFTDVTELSSNERECEKGFNSFIMLTSLVYIACLVAESYYFTQYATYISIFSYLVLFVMIIYPLFKLMAKTSLYFFIYYVIFLNVFSFSFGPDYVASGLLCLLYFIGLNIPGAFYNYKYFKDISSKKEFTLDEIEANKLSLFWIYNKLFNKQSVDAYLENEKKLLNNI